MALVAGQGVPWIFVDTWVPVCPQAASSRLSDSKKNPLRDFHDGLPWRDVNDVRILPPVCSFEQDQQIADPGGQLQGRLLEDPVTLLERSLHGCRVGETPV